MSDVTRILSKIESGDPKASEELLPLVYDELRKLAAARMSQQRPEHTLSATALVHEAYLRLVDQEQVQNWDSCGHFFSAAAEAMRRILIDSLRRKQSLKRGGNLERESWDDQLEFELAPDLDELLDLNDAIDQMEKESPQTAELVKLRLFGGLSLTQAGEILGLPTSTAHVHWRYASAWLERRVNSD